MRAAMKTVAIGVFAIMIVAAIFTFALADVKESVLTPEQIATWELVKEFPTAGYGLMLIRIYINPIVSSPYAAAYLMFCEGGEICQYGFLENGKLRGFLRTHDGRYEEYFGYKYNHEQELKSYLPKRENI